MRLAFLIQCHKNVDQINELINVLTHPSVDIYIHIDKKNKSNIVNKLIDSQSLYILEDQETVNVEWATFSQVEATLNLLKKAYLKKYDYFWLISGQCFPIQSIDLILKRLSESNYKYNYMNLFNSKNIIGKNTNYDKRNEIVYPKFLLKRDLFHRVIRRLWVLVTGGYEHTFFIFKRANKLNIKYYFGSCWWCINYEFADYVLKYIKKHPEYIEYFKKCSCPDESFFQTLLMNSEYAKTQTDYLHYIDWSEGGSSPKVFNSDKCFARKIDSIIDGNIINELKDKIGDKK